MQKHVEILAQEENTDKRKCLVAFALQYRQMRSEWILDFVVLCIN